MYLRFGLVVFGSILVGTLQGQEGPRELPGVVDLDFITFDKVIDGSKNVLVRFDDKYNYEEQYEQWQYFVAEMADRSNLLLAQCTISQYEETMENFEIFERYGISMEYLPKFVLFKQDEDRSAAIVYPRKNTEGYLVTSEELKQLLNDENVWLGLEGTLKEFSDLVNDFVNLFDNGKKEEMMKLHGMTSDEIRDDIGKKGKNIVSKFEENSKDSGNDLNLKSAKYYMKVMSKMVAQGKEYAQKEFDRIENLLYNENVQHSLKKWFSIRMNILSMFGAQSSRQPEYPYPGDDYDGAGYDDMYGDDMYGDMHYDL